MIYTVTAKSECIEWTKGKTVAGYGRVLFDGVEQYVHRLAYRMFHDLDTKDMPSVVRHSCDNPSCYNVEHLEGGTKGDNNRDRAERGRNGVRPLQKLSDEQVSIIRYRLGEGESQGSIAKDYGVSRQLIGQIHRGEAR